MVAALAANRFAVPALVAFLGLGMVLGSDGPGGIEFSDADLARTVGVAGLVAILYEGGLTTSWRRLWPVLAPAAALGTAGVVISMLVTGLAAYLVFDLSWLESLLLGAVVASTDAAAVFATLRFTPVRRRLARLLEAESGLNDPMAVALTIGLIEWITEPAYGAADLTLLLVRQLGLGLVVGVAFGWAAARGARALGATAGPFVPVASVSVAALSFGAADVLDGSGFLAVYIVGLFVGNAPTRHRRELVTFHTGLAFLAQVALFVVLGLLVFPRQLDSVVLSGLALAAVLTLVARPLSVWICTAVGKFTVRERVFLGWAGLRGAVPIVLATFALSADIGASDTIFNAVFFVVLASAVVQGPTLERLVARLGLQSRARPSDEAPLQIVAVESLGSDLLEYVVDDDDVIVGRAVRDFGLPRDTLLAVVVRDDEAIPPRGSTVIEPGDRLFVLAPRTIRADLEDVFSRWRRRV